MNKLKSIKVEKKMGHDNQVFIVRNPKKIAFWKKLAQSSSGIIITELKTR